MVVCDESGGVEGREETGEGLLGAFDGILAATIGEWLLGELSYSLRS